jgi:hypothetical protein
VDHALEGTLNAFQIAFEGRLTPAVGVHLNAASDVQGYVPTFKRLSCRRRTGAARSLTVRDRAGQSRAPFGRRYAMGLLPTLDSPSCPGALLAIGLPRPCGDRAAGHVHVYPAGDCSDPSLRRSPPGRGGFRSGAGRSAGRRGLPFLGCGNLRL